MTADRSLGPAYRVHTPRLVVRCWDPGDAPLLRAALVASYDHLRPWMPWARGEPEDVEALVARIRRWRGEFDLGQDYVYGVFSADEREVRGGSGLHTRAGEDAREIGYWIHAAHINQGLATEVAGALTRVAFEVDRLRRVEIHCDPANARSAAVARKLGYLHEATLRQRGMIWTMVADEYPGSSASQVEIEAFDAAGQRIL